MKLALAWFVAVWLCAGELFAQSPVMLSIGKDPQAKLIYPDFVGLSFGMKALLPNAGGAYFFSATNAQLVTLFHNLGIRHLRLGGTTVESPPSTPIPDERAIDSFFGFVKAAGVQKVIYSFRLIETNSALNYAATNALLAKYIWSHYRDYIECFAIGNEPDLRRVYDQDVTITNFTTYLAKWKRFAEAIKQAVPQAKFTGPDGGSGNVRWTTQFSKDEKNSGWVEVVSEHYYAGGAGRGLSKDEGLQTILTAKRVDGYQKLYQDVTKPVLADGMAFRFTEANDHYSGGVADASDAFAGALWSLDFLHWWAAHDTEGVDFHNTQWVVNDVITPDANGGWRANPKGYGLAAFNLSGNGSSEAVKISSADKINLTAYAVRGGHNLFVTVINKDFGAQKRDASVTILSDAVGTQCQTLSLVAPDGDVAAKTGVTLGGAAIDAKFPWPGQWTSIVPDKPGWCEVNVPAGSAVIVKISLK